MIPRNTIGVYLIRNTENGAVYVGSSARNINERLYKHQTMLRAGTHSNAHLQHAWNAYGPIAFVFEIIEYTETKDETIAREQFWLDYYKQQTTCYNFSPTAGSTKGWAKPRNSIIAKTYPGFRGPDGMEYRNVHNLAQFCREHNLSKGAMARLSRGENNTTKEGWRRIDDDNTYTYSFIDPQGNRVDNIKELKSFCREHSLTYDAMRRVSRGKNAQHRGWTRIDFDRSLLKQGTNRKRSGRGIQFAFIAPDGTVYKDIDNLTLFAERNGLTVANLHRVHVGDRRHHKGWRKAT